MADNNSNAFFRGGKRFGGQSVDMDALAQSQGFPDFSTMQQVAPELAQQLAFQNGGDNPGTSYDQSAAHDDLDAKRLAMIIGGTVAGGALGDYFAGGATGAGAAAPSAAAPSLGAPSALGTIPGATAGTFGGGATAAGAGGLSKALGYVGQAGKAISAMNAGAAQGRVVEGEQNRAQSDALLRRYQAQLNANQQATNTRQTNYKNAIAGGYLQGVQDFQLNGLPDYIRSRMPTITGGARPSAIIGKEQIGAQMQREALLDLMAGGGGMRGLSQIPVPPVPVQPQQGGLSKTADWLGPALAIAGSYFGR